MEYDNEKIKFIQDYTIFHLLRAKAKKNKKNYSTFDLLPNEDYGQHEAQTYYHKAICWMLANNDYKRFEELYNNYSEHEIWDMLAIMNAVNYYE